MSDQQPPAPEAFFRARNGERVRLPTSEDGRFLCPVCSAPLAQAPYGPDGEPSRDFCPDCDVQFGWDDVIPPDAPPGSQQRKWDELREQRRLGR